MEEQDITPEETIDSAAETETKTATKAPKKKHRLLKTLGAIVIIIAVITVSLGFFFPGLLWTKDLGVRYSEADYKSIMAKLDYIKDAVPTGESKDGYVYTYGKTTNISTEFTSAEITAFVNTGRPDYFAVKNVQVRINKDGTVDASGIVNVDYFLSEVLSGKFSREQIAKEIPALGFLPSSVNLALNIDGGIANNKASGSINSAEVQGIPIPTEYVNSDEAVSTVTGGLNNMLSKNNSKSGSVFEKLAIENEKVVLTGKFPSSLTRTQK